MAVPPAPPPLEQLGPRPFSFYPAIGNIAHNEWLYQRATWSEVLIRNTKTAEEIWVPRRLLGEISRIDEPVMIVGSFERAREVGPANAGSAVGNASRVADDGERIDLEGGKGIGHHIDHRRGDRIRRPAPPGCD